MELTAEERIAKLRELVEPLRALEAKATKGPWQFTLHPVDESADTLRGSSGEPLRRIDAKLMMAMRTVLPALLAAIDGGK